MVNGDVLCWSTLIFLACNKVMHYLLKINDQYSVAIMSSCTLVWNKN